jgi:hypothetical protein
MNWPMMEDLYLAFTRIIDGFIKFLAKAFGVEE